MKGWNGKSDGNCYIFVACKLIYSWNSTEHGNSLTFFWSSKLLIRDGGFRAFRVGLNGRLQQHWPALTRRPFAWHGIPNSACPKHLCPVKKEIIWYSLSFPRRSRTNPFPK